MTFARAQSGFILLPVVVTLTLLAAIAYLLNRDAGMNVNAGARGLEADSARYIAEAGLSRANYGAQNANCVSYPAFSNVAFGAGQFTASATPASGSPVTLSATATLASGATATLTRADVPVYRTTPFTVTLQPATQLQDAFIQSNGGHQTRNNGGDANLRLDDKTRSLLRFDLSSIPSTAIVQSAQMMLYKSNGGGGPAGSTITAYPLTQAWVEGTQTDGSPANGVTWNTSDGTTAWTTAGGNYDTSSGAATASTDNNNVWVSWDLTPVAASWVSGATANQGVILIPSASIPGQAYVSGDDTTQRANTPKLVVTFRARCDWTPPPASVTLTAGSDSYLDKTNAAVNYGSAASIPLADKVNLRGLFQFDISSVTPGALLTSAKLRLYVASLDTRSGNTMNLEVRALTNVWTEAAVSWSARTGSANWSTQGGDYSGATATLAVPASFSGGWIEFDVTTLAQAWVDGITANNGVIVLEKSDDRFFVATREAGAATAPQLVLTY